MPANIVDFEVDWADCDPAGIVFYPAFFRMMNTATHKLFNDAGIPFCELPARYNSVGTPMLDVQCTFRSPAKFGDKIQMSSQIVEWRDKTFVIEHVMRSGERVLFEAKEVRAWAIKDDTATFGIKARPFPDDVRKALAKWTKA